MTFDFNAGIASARGSLDKTCDAIQEQMATTRDRLMEAVVAYARHLNAGGDPTVLPEPPGEMRNWNESSGWCTRAGLSLTNALKPVYEAWNEARGSKNTIFPGNKVGWMIGEVMFARFGEPVTFEEIKMIGCSHKRGHSPNEVQRALMALQEDLYVVRATKVGGKKAYLIRDKREGEEPHTSAFSLIPFEDAAAVA